MPTRPAWRAPAKRGAAVAAGHFPAPPCCSRSRMEWQRPRADILSRSSQHPPPLLLSLPLNQSMQRMPLGRIRAGAPPLALHRNAVVFLLRAALDRDDRRRVRPDPEAGSDVAEQ